MKKLLRVFFVLLSLLLVAVLGAVAFIHFLGIPTYQPKKVDLKVEVNPQRVAQGAKIGQLMCFGCHAAETAPVLSGNYMADANFFGEIYAANITQHPTLGIGKWTDGELAVFLHTGVRPNGTFVPLMPKFPYLADEDLHAIIAYLRSDHPAVQAKAVKSQPSRYNFFAKFLSHLAIKPFEYPQKRS
ncbi:MAG: cytochrome c [Bacteroidia bacterium]|nr:cytochrome c [Bacteroidia bacterium]